MKTNISRIVAMLYGALLLQIMPAAAQQGVQAPAANQPTANAPMAQQPAVSAPNMAEPAVNQPAASVSTLSSTGRTHDNVSSNSGAYNVSAGQTAAGFNAKFKPVNTKTFKATNGAGSGSAFSGSSSSRSAAAPAIGGSATGVGSIGSRLFGTSTSNYQPVSNKSIGTFGNSGFYTQQTNAYVDESGSETTGNWWGGPGGLGDGVLKEPIGDAILPLLFLLLGYAAIRSFRKKEENA